MLRVLQWLRRLPASTSRRLVGRDSAGREYYEVDHSGRTSRLVFSKTAEEDYDPRELPVEWAAWLSRTRAEPPTEQEIAQRELDDQQVQINVLKKEKEAQQQLSQPVQTSAQQSSSTTGTAAQGSAAADELATQAWQPGQRAPKKPQPLPAQDHDFEPEPWQPPSGRSDRRR